MQLKFILQESLIYEEKYRSDWLTLKEKYFGEILEEDLTLNFPERQLRSSILTEKSCRTVPTKDTSKKRERFKASQSLKFLRKESSDITDSYDGRENNVSEMDSTDFQKNTSKYDLS